MKRTDRRSDCPTNYALQVFGDSWSLLIVRDLMFAGKRTYADFASSDEQISTSVLANRLVSLLEAGIIRREGSGRATRYSLTTKGLDLLPMMVDMILWSAKYDPDTAAPAELVHRGMMNRESLLSELETRVREEHGLGSAA